MRPRYLANFAFPICLCIAACSLEEPADDDGGDAGSSGTGTSGKGGSTSGAAGSTAGQSGAQASGGSAGKGAAGAGMGGTSSPAGGTSPGGTSNSGGAGAGGTPPTAGTSPGGSSGDTSTGGSAQAGSSSGSGGSGAGGSDGGSGGSAPGGTGGTGEPGGSGGGGNENVSGMPIPPGDANVPKPSGTPGNITVVNWAGFKGAVTYSFDDNNSTQIQHYAEMQSLGVRFTFYLWTGKSEFTNSVWGTAKTDGHELANHTKSHSSNGTGADIDAAQSDIMSRYGVTAYTMAAPNGASVYTGLANSRFMINRGVSNKLIMPNDNSDPFTLPTFIPPTGAGESQFNQQVDSARSGGGWVTMCIHGFSGGSDGAYQPVDFNGWKASVTHAKSLGDMWIDSMENVAAYWRGQKSFSSATSATAGSDKTWTWTLPDHFPPGKYLRVKVEGGTLKQNGTALPWNGHGWYEISLDAKSVTLSP